MLGRQFSNYVTRQGLSLMIISHKRKKSLRRNEEYEIFTFRQAQQQARETLDLFHARLQQLAKNCNFQNKNREIKSQIVQK
ncbi:hypothetical protein LSAT2_024698, partial [Lamellibrachia satsuma]